jgi:hypothetical protein
MKKSLLQRRTKKRIRNKTKKKGGFLLNSLRDKAVTMRRRLLDTNGKLINDFYNEVAKRLINDFNEQYKKDLPDKQIKYLKSLIWFFNKIKYVKNKFFLDNLSIDKDVFINDDVNITTVTDDEQKTINMYRNLMQIMKNKNLGDETLHTFISEFVLYTVYNVLHDKYNNNLKIIEEKSKSNEICLKIILYLNSEIHKLRKSQLKTLFNRNSNKQDLSVKKDEDEDGELTTRDVLLKRPSLEETFDNSGRL